MSNTDATPFELHARRFVGRLQKLTHDFRTGSVPVESVLEEVDRIWPQIEAGFAWSVENEESMTTAAELCLEFASCGDPAGGNAPLSLRQSLNESRLWIEAALVASRVLDLPIQEASCHYQLASIAFTEHDLAEAETHAERALRLFHDAGDQRLAAISRNVLGLVATANGEIDAAVCHFENALGVFGTLDLSGDVVFTTQLLARAYIAGGQFEEALHLAREARDRSREQEDESGEFSAFKTMAAALAGLGEQKELDAVCTKVVSRPDDENVLARSVGAFGLVDLIRLESMEDVAAFSQLDRDLVGFRKLGNWIGEGFTLLGLGLAHTRHGDNDAGRVCLEEGRAVFSKHEYGFGVALAQKYLDRHFPES